MLISESEKYDILSKYNQSALDEFTITDWVSPDGNFVIFLDELYDVRKKTKLGDVWENFDNFKFFLEHCFKTSDHISEQVKKTLLEDIKSLPILEVDQDMRHLKPQFKLILKEWTSNPFSKDFYTKDNWKEIGKDIQGVSKDAWQGVKDIGNSIAQSDWMKALDILKKGVLYVLRRIREFLYHPVGLILDAIMIASGFGLGFVKAAWACVVALDVYELMTKDYEDKELSMGWRLAFFGIDIMGLVTAGAAAKAARISAETAIKVNGKTSQGLAKSVKKNKGLESTFAQILKLSSKAESELIQVSNKLATKAPKFHKFISGILSFFKEFLTMMVNTLSAILNAAGSVLNVPGKIVSKLGPKNSRVVMGAAAAANTGVPMAAIHLYNKDKQKKFDDEVLKAVEDDEVKPDYGDRF